MESPARRTRWSGDPSINDGRPWSFGIAAPAATSNSAAGTSSGNDMPGAYPISTHSNCSLPNFSFGDPGEEWHELSSRSSIRGTTVNRFSGSNNFTNGSEFVVDIENLKIGTDNIAEAGRGGIHRSTAFPQYPPQAHHSIINNVRTPVTARQHRHSNTWSVADLEPRTSNDLPWNQMNSSHSRHNALSGAFSLEGDNPTTQVHSLRGANSNGIQPREFVWERGHRRVATPDINIHLAAYAYADKSPGILGYICGAVKEFVFSCIGPRFKNPKSEYTHDSQTHCAPVDEFIINIDEETGHDGTTGYDYPIEDDRSEDIQIEYEEEEERPLSILLPPCPVYISEQHSRPKSRPVSYPGAPENVSLASIRREIELELDGEHVDTIGIGDPIDTIGDGDPMDAVDDGDPMNTIHDGDAINTTDDYQVSDDDIESDFDDYHEFLRNGIQAEMKDYYQRRKDIGAAQITPDEHEFCDSSQKNPKKSRKRLNGLLSPIVGAASSAVKNFLSSTLSAGHDEDGSGFSSTKNSPPSAPSLIRAAIGTSIIHARKFAGLRRNGDTSIIEAPDSPEEITHPKLLDIFGRQFDEDEIRPSTPESKMKYDYIQKELRFEMRGTTVREETEDSLYLFEHPYDDSEEYGFEEDGITGEDLDDEQSMNEAFEEERLHDDEISEDGTSEGEFDEDPFILDSPELGGPGGYIVRKKMHSEDVAEHLRMRNDQLNFEEAFISMYEDKKAFDAAHPDSINGSESDPSDGSNDPDSCKGSSAIGTKDNINSSPVAAASVIEHIISTISTISVVSISKTEAIKTLHKEPDPLGIRSPDALSDNVTRTSRHTSTVSFIERTDTFQNLNNFFGAEEDSEDDSAKLVYNGHNSLVYRDRAGANEIDIQVPPGMDHVSHYIRTVESKQNVVNMAKATPFKERAGRVSYTHLYDPEDRVASDEDDREHEKEYRKYIEHQQQLWNC